MRGEIRRLLRETNESASFWSNTDLLDLFNQNLDKWCLELAETYARGFASIWKRPLDELEIELEEMRPRRARALRGLFYRHTWPRPTVVLLVGCNSAACRFAHPRHGCVGRIRPSEDSGEVQRKGEIGEC